MSKTVLTKEEAEKVVVAFSPRRFPASISQTASDFVAFNANIENNSFRLDHLVAQQTGIAEIERQSLEEKVEQEALGRLKDIQEDAYREAYSLGLDEGREKAFQEYKDEMGQRLGHLEEILVSLEQLKTDLIAANETQIVQLIFYMAKRVILKEVETSRDMILSVVQQAIQSAQSDDSVTVRVSQSDFEFIEAMKEKIGKEFDGIKQARLEVGNDISSGGCIVQTNYGEVNATLEQRIEKLWSAVSEKLPKTNTSTGSGEA